MSIHASRDEWVDVDRSKNCTESVVKRLCVLWGFAHHVRSYASKLSCHSRLDCVAKRVPDRFAGFLLWSYREFADEVVIDGGGGQLLQPRIYAAEQIGLLRAPRRSREECRAELRKFERGGVPCVLPPGGPLGFARCDADETLPPPGEWEPSVNVVAHLNVRLGSNLTMSS